MTKAEFKKEVKKRKAFYILNILKAAERAGLDYKLIRQEGRDFYYQLSYQDKHVYVLNHYIYYNLDRLNVARTINKDFTKVVLNKIGIKTPQGINVSKFSEIKKGQLNFPVVLKPNNWSAGKGVIVNIKNSARLKRAWNRINKIKHSRKKTSFIIEEYFPGKDYRLLILKGKFLACIERVGPQIIGDGQSKIKDLIIEQVRLTGIHRLNIDWEVKRNLKNNNLTMSSIIPKGKKIFLRGNSNMSTGGVTINRTKEVCSKFKKIAEQCAKEFDIQLAGVDILTSDISDPRADYRVIEINHNPDFYYAHDKPNIGQSENVTPKILKAIFNIK